jgi:hypothetical protein
MTSFEGNTGPFLQYSHARLCSIEEKAKERENLQIVFDIPFEKLLKVLVSLKCTKTNRFSRKRKQPTWCRHCHSIPPFWKIRISNLNLAYLLRI